MRRFNRQKAASERINGDSVFDKPGGYKNGNKVKRIPHFLRQEVRLSLNR